jgi:hypothetical protein
VDPGRERRKWGIDSEFSGGYRTGETKCFDFEPRSYRQGYSLKNNCTAGNLEPRFLMFYYYNSTERFGPWANVRNRYLGLKFYVKGKAHYGWARLSTGNYLDPWATLTGYAYETTPYKAIKAGQTKESDLVAVEPGSLGALAAGRNGRK